MRILWEFFCFSSELVMTVSSLFFADFLWFSFFCFSNMLFYALQQQQHNSYYSYSYRVRERESEIEKVEIQRKVCSK